MNMGNNLIDNFSSVSISKKQAVIPKQIVLNENTPGFTNKNSGLQIEAAFQKEGADIKLYLTFTNNSNVAIQVKFCFNF
jgi:uncharacterized protein (DUF736 family)